MLIVHGKLCVNSLAFASSLGSSSFQFRGLAEIRIDYAEGMSKLNRCGAVSMPWACLVMLKWPPYESL